MRRNLAAPALILAAAALFTVVLASCATSKGSTLGTVIAAESGRKTPARPQQPSPEPPADLKGLQILTSPDRAEVWLDGSFAGLSPFTTDTIGRGPHRIVIRKEGYYESSAWVEFQGVPMVYRADLEQIVGFLQVSVIPEEGIVTVGGERVSQGLATLPVGTYTILVRAFGYVQHEESVVIMEKSVTNVSVTLQPAPFAVTSFSLPKTAVNPENPGVLGALEYDLSVSAPGTGTVRVTDAARNEVYSTTLPQFTTWDQSYSWDLRDSAGRVLPDGSYTMSLTASGSGSDLTLARELAFAVDRSLKIAPRSLWSGSAGLLYSPVAEVLPAGDFQVGLLGAGVAAGAPPLFQAPVLLGARFGASTGMEIDASLGVVVSSVAAPLTGSVSARWNLVSPRGPSGTAMAVLVKLAAQVNPEAGSVLMTDTFANFTGVSVELPFQLVLERLSLLLSFGAAGSLWYPYRWDPAFTPDKVPLLGAVGWLYLRAGVMLDMGSVMAGLSASTRTQPLPGGISLLSSPIPFEAGVELHWLIPGTRFVLSAIAAGEYQDSQDYYFMGGAGLGFLY